jgi:hypothetical protein
LSAQVWVRLSASDGAKSLRLYDRAYLPCGSAQPPWKTGLLIRKLTRPHQFTLYLILAPKPTSLADLVRVA